MASSVVTPVDRIGQDPMAQFAEYFAQARSLDRALLADPTAMVLATATADGHPSARMVLLKQADERGFVFYTNTESRKGRELIANPWAALCFHWVPLALQVRVEGQAERVSDAEGDAYFASRARASQLGAWASAQSRPLVGAGELAERVRQVEDRYDGRDVPRPPFWTGFRVVPHAIEFWLDRPFRLHDRVRYERPRGERDGRWSATRLYP